MKTLLRNPWLLIGLIVLVVLALLCLDADLSWARPGGGDSFSGGGGGGGSSGGGSSGSSSSYSSGSSSSSSSGGGSGDGEFLLFIILGLIYLTVEYPYVMIPLYIFFFMYWLVERLRKKKKPVVVSTRIIHRQQGQREEQVRNFRKRDMNFSEPLFLDFANALYHEYYSRLGTKGIVQLRPFLPDNLYQEALHQTLGKPPGESDLSPEKRGPVRTYSDIVVGALYIDTIFTGLRDGQWDAIVVYFHTNLSVHINGSITRYYREERWDFSRKAGVKSLEPQKLQSLACTNCAAPLNLNDSGGCSACGHVAEPGAEQWLVVKMHLNKNQPQGNQRGSLLAQVPERGTNLPTVFSPNLKKGIAVLMYDERLADEDWPKYESAFAENVIRPCFMQLYHAWSARSWEGVRPILTDRLFESQKMWIDEYKRQRLINKLENIEIQKIETVKVDVDMYYAAITVRIFARCLDYVTDEKGTVLKGSAKKLRPFSEYWTFVKNCAVKSGDKPSATTKSCPSCGAAVKVNLAGKCEFCASKVTDGAFNWVLSRIEQDDTYGS